MTYQLNQRELIIDLESGEFQIQPIRTRIEGRRIVGPVDYGWARFLEAQRKSDRRDPLVTTWGGGPLAGSRIPGARRLVFCGYSPSWEGFYVSSLGGAAYVMHRIGVDFVCLQGAARQDSVLVLNHRHGDVQVRLEPINPDVIWTGYADADGERLFGFYALQQAVFDRYNSEYDEDWVRVIACGPAARSTQEGILGSNQVKRRRLSAIDDWAGRGGLGSRLLQTQHIAACIFGGDWEDPDLKDSKEIDRYFQTYYGASMIKVDLGATEKYRYVPGFQTGGTFGVNMHTADDNLWSFNYTSIFASDEERMAQHQAFVRDHYLRQFNEEIIAPKNFAHCGEPCSVACKKYVGRYKKDYEPYQALGPQCGVFDQRAAERLNHFVDALGIDAIQIGGMIAWLLECIADGLIPPEDFGLPPREQLHFGFVSKTEDFDLVADSELNSAYAERVAALIVLEPVGEIFHQGLRAAAKALDEKYGLEIHGLRSIDRAVFNSHGEQGCMTPNQYWVPGMLAPMPMMGKYFVYYGVDYLPPHLLGQRCVERMVYELYCENSGVCRFHRKWAETIVDEIISSHYLFHLDYKTHQYELVQAIYNHQGNTAVFWESARCVEVIWQYLEKWGRAGLQEPTLLEWIDRFRKDAAENGQPWQAARAYWDEIRAGIEAALHAGAQAIPENVAPYQAARMDLMDKR